MKMNNRNKEISLHLENDVASAMITMFSQLGKVENDKEIIITNDGKTVIHRDKALEDIIEFQFEFSDLKTKIFDWFSSGNEWLHLDKTESELFRACSHAAYYYMVETTELKHLKQSHFIRFHEQLFKK